MNTSRTYSEADCDCDHCIGLSGSVATLKGLLASLALGVEPE
jgi:hypothetical protein